MGEYSVQVAYATKELATKERIRIKDLKGAKPLDELTANCDFAIKYAYHAVLEVHNENADNTDYRKCVVVDKDGSRYVTGSESFISSLEQMADDLSDLEADGEEVEIVVTRRESKNYKGKTYITCFIK